MYFCIKLTTNTMTLEKAAELSSLCAHLEMVRNVLDSANAGSCISLMCGGYMCSGIKDHDDRPCDAEFTDQLIKLLEAQVQRYTDRIESM